MLRYTVRMAKKEIVPIPQSPREIPISREATSEPNAEHVVEGATLKDDRIIEESDVPVVRDVSSAQLVTPQKDDLTMQIEGILEEGLGQLYTTLPEDAKPLFRQKGEETSHEISSFLRRAKVKASQILQLIRDWLLTIPKVNTFFLEQEAKIKTDRLLELHREQTNTTPPT